jgi:uncharacterized protein (TIGR02722 family)
MIRGYGGNNLISTDWGDRERKRTPRGALAPMAVSCALAREKLLGGVFMSRIVLILVVSLIAAGVTGCGKKVARIEIDKQVDLSGKWNDTDSRLVSEEMIKDCLSRTWIDHHQINAGQRPTVIVGTILNKTDEHIISETFTKDLEKAFINSGRVQMVASREERDEVRDERDEMQEHSSAESVKKLRNEKASDYMMKGVINSIRDKEKKKSVILYQIDLELIDTETNQKVWIGDKKIKKYIKK